MLSAETIFILCTKLSMATTSSQLPTVNPDDLAQTLWRLYIDRDTQPACGSAPDGFGSNLEAFEVKVEPLANFIGVTMKVPL